MRGGKVKDKEKKRKVKEVKKAVRKATKEKPKKQNEISMRTPFIRERMWLSYLLSSFTKDIGKIPENIGNDIRVTNNTYITKNFISSIIHVEELGFNTPTVVLEQIAQRLRDKDSSAICDFTIKNQPFYVDLNSSGLKSRIYSWESQLTSPYIHKSSKQRAAGCLYTVEKARAGDTLYKSRLYITLRAKRGTELTVAEKIVCSYLGSIGAKFTVVSGDIQRYLSYISIVSDTRDTELKDLPAVVTDATVLSQIMPNLDGYTNNNALYLGINKTNNSLYRLNLKDITLSRNMYIIAPSGVGKTVLALNFACSAFEQGFAVCAMDIKGNEFTYFTRVTGGKVVSLGPRASEYINSFRMHANEVGPEGEEIYFKERLAFSKQQLLILTGISDEDKLLKLSDLFEEFLSTVYVQLGVVASNKNTWVYSQSLNPFVIFDKLTDYMSSTVVNKYGRVADEAYSALRQYISRNGSMSYLFKQEFSYKELLDAPTLTFAFGLLDGTVDNVPLFKLKFLYMRKLNADYAKHKAARGQKLLKILEESLVVDDDVMQSYVEEITLRRAQGQSTLLLGNSVTVLKSRVAAAPIIENMKGIFIGNLLPDAKETAIKAFDLQPYHEIIDMIGSEEEYQNTFVFVNRMQSNSLTPILKLELDTKHEHYKLITPERSE